MTFFALNKQLRVFGGLLCAALMVACADTARQTLPASETYASRTTDPAEYTYLIGPGDELSIFVWRNPEVSADVTVRPDGRITMPLVEDLQASGRTATELAREIEGLLNTYIRNPIVTVIVEGGVGPYSEYIRVVGQAAEPMVLPYVEKMTLLDVIIQVGGLTEFAAGNRATIVRLVDNQRKQYKVRVDDLVNSGDITANVDMLPGDILIIPEAWF